MSPLHLLFSIRHNNDLECAILSPIYRFHSIVPSTLLIAATLTIINKNESLERSVTNQVFTHQPNHHLSHYQTVNKTFLELGRVVEV